MTSPSKSSKIYADVKHIEVLEVDPPMKMKYLELHRLTFQNHYPDDQISKPYTYETVVRKHLDAVAVLPFTGKGTNPQVHLRRTLRPALVIREYIQSKSSPGILTLQHSPIVLEVVAGILESEDHGMAGKKKRAIAELWEEAGFRGEENNLISLGVGILPTPGMNPERIDLFAIEVNPETIQHPPGDGSPVEDIGGLVSYSLLEALDACDRGDIIDAKTEISLHRFKRILEKR